ncbi:MAG: DUF861 domain-containing protein [Flavobacteriales bacterium]|nr:DUF861 domain-containing protein [Flavobacteriales bacterium]
MAIIQLKEAGSIPSEELEDWGSAENSISELVSQKSGIEMTCNEDGTGSGIWECTPGTWPRTIMFAEISTFLKGHAIFTPEIGEPIEIKAGDVVYFDRNSKGVWEIIETVRKAYLIY